MMTSILQQSDGSLNCTSEIGYGQGSTNLLDEAATGPQEKRATIVKQVIKYGRRLDRNSEMSIMI